MYRHTYTMAEREEERENINGITVLLRSRFAENRGLCIFQYFQTTALFFFWCIDDFITKYFEYIVDELMNH